MNKRQAILDTAVRLFAAQGYEATTTLQIAREVGVTEPAVFYHFKNKESLFSVILEEALNVYLQHLDAVDIETSTPFASLELLIRIHFSIVAEIPERMSILLRTCPARLEDPQSTCTKVYRKARSTLKTMLGKILEKGMASGEFAQIEINASANMLIAMLNGLMRQQIAAMETLDGVESATIAFCKKSLTNPEKKRPRYATASGVSA